MTGPCRAEIWALCRPCDRWFLCGAWLDATTGSAPTCPVCASDPVAIENRPSWENNQHGASPPESEPGMQRPRPAGWLNLED